MWFTSECHRGLFFFFWLLASCHRKQVHPPPPFPRGFSSIRVYWSRSNEKHLGLFQSYLPHPNSESCTVVFMDSLLFKEYSFKFSKFFLAGSTGWHLVQPVHQVSLYEALILVVLEPKSFLVQAHKLQISPRHSLGPIMGHFLGFLQPP